MDIDRPLVLLGGLSPAAFMRRHWQRRPLLVRGAIPDVRPPIAAPELFALAGDDAVESRLIERRDGAWRLRHGPFARRSLPPLARPGWTLLVQNVDAHVDAAHELLARYRFVPDARLDDLMISWASDGGGVGPHVDSYDVFLLQVEGRRRWRIGPAGSADFEPGLPLKILRRFEPDQEWLLEPGDMLYLPPGWAHDGVAEGPCMTCSIGFRAGGAVELAREVLQSLAEGCELPERDRRYADRGQPATAEPGRLPTALLDFAAQQVQRLLADRRLLGRALGEVLSTPRPAARFALRDDDEEAGDAWPADQAAVLDRATRMLYDEAHVYINGEAFRAGGRDARLMRRLADDRRLDVRSIGQLSDEARELLAEWYGAGWLHARPDGAG